MRTNELMFAPEIEKVLRELEHEFRDLDELGRAKRVRKRLDAARASAALELHALRNRAATKFARPELVFLTRKGLEQATPLAMARERARRIAERVDRGCVVDATCGLGADSIALAERGLRVLACDRDELHARCARMNLERCTSQNWAGRAEAERLPTRARWLLLDPDRRAKGGRTLAAQEFAPSWAASLSIANAAAGACIKLPPSFEVDAREGGELAALRRSWTWTSVGGELVETTLWLGEWASNADVSLREACVLPAGGGRGASFVARAESIDAWEPAEARAIEFLHEPDNALIRAGLVGAFARHSAARPLAREIAYLGSRAPFASDFAASWRVVESSSLDSKRVRAMLARHDVGAIQVRKRGNPERAEELERRFRGSGARRGTLVVTRLGDEHVAYLVEPLPSPTSASLVGDEGFEPPTSSL